MNIKLLSDKLKDPAASFLGGQENQLDIRTVRDAVEALDTDFGKHLVSVRDQLKKDLSDLEDVIANSPDVELLVLDVEKKIEQLSALSDKRNAKIADSLDFVYSEIDMIKTEITKLKGQIHTLQAFDSNIPSSFFGRLKWLIFG